jgi:hypothetical protein
VSQRAASLPTILKNHGHLPVLVCA